VIAIRARRLFDGRDFQADRTVLVDGPRIIDVLPSHAAIPDARIIDLPDGLVLAPGYVDLQVNGGGGRMLNDAPTRDTIAAIADAHADMGSTTILPTLISGSWSTRRDLLACLGSDGLGHVEGPFFAPSRRGIHPAAAIAAPDEADLAQLSRPVMLTLAPDIVTPAQVARLVKAGAIVFIGHTEASYAQARAALDAGASGFTHLYNAMSQMTGRGPGAVGAALDHPSAYAGIIVDGHHVHPASIRIAFAALGPGRLFLVSDAMATAASMVRAFTLYGELIRLVDGRLTNADGTLAGAHLTLAEAVRNAVNLVGIAPKDALRMATATPAEVLRRPDLGRIGAGCSADLITLDENLFVQDVCRRGDAAALSDRGRRPEGQRKSRS